MKIYDRYKLDSSEERQRQRDRIAKSRRGLRWDYNFAQNLAAIGFIVFLGLAAVLVMFQDTLPGLICAVLEVLLGAALVICLVFLLNMERIGGDDGEPDLYIYGMKNGRFLLLNQLYETLKRVDPTDVKEILILSAMRPTTRQRHFRSRAKIRIENTDYEYFGEKQASGKIRSYPMAVLCTEKKRIKWNYTDDPNFRRKMNSLLTFVPMGEREEHFAYLLQKSDCPVVVAPKVCRRYRAHLDALFIRSGMDMTRIEFIKEKAEKPKRISIIG